MTPYRYRAPRPRLTRLQCLLIVAVCGAIAAGLLVWWLNSL